MGVASVVFALERLVHEAAKLSVAQAPLRIGNRLPILGGQYLLRQTLIRGIDSEPSNGALLPSSLKIAIFGENSIKENQCPNHNSLSAAPRQKN
ncbi:hypothetical protein GGD50_006515 [Rhizobium paranaense]|uniref:Uncharacterized protein n=1 Tax=Rhizobium paranaense TaxID=1650438 RepID=A0A7W8XYD5_9HYPH|nr:hypothetical protein [Rhizobium paranaense]